MNKVTKPFLKIEDQLKHMESKGITFNIISRDEARNYLTENNNYFKLRAFRKNYDKVSGGENDGKYIGLDFGMLCDLATIDMHVRYCVLQLALNTEHFLKVKLLKRCELNNEDGYAIVNDYFNHIKVSDKKHNRLSNELERNRNNPYCGGIIESCSDGYAIWAFIEVVSLGTLLDFYKFCADRFNDDDMKNDYYLMRTVRPLRNAAAHNNCIISDLRAKDRNFQPDKEMLKELSSIRKDTKNKRLSNIRMLQICTLLYTHKKIGSSASNGAARRLLNELVNRMIRNKDYYMKNTTFVGNFTFLKKIVEIFFQEC
ncbi:Abi-like protein [Acetitomaculum ruminis DSM 5522]|uniref:Abi-like protein n=1 Tax=Acetitomaculum ruminis DSM 5522 TaxID=1120918 RepID=A0A1I0WGM3_9FIRM|nr:Abi family protein [Acetitomaculum ruminis]SFA87123.1 Abi-like protein [Acetitomaculum ruminis DSM 5522]